jgi:hypothetical protein
MVAFSRGQRGDRPMSVPLGNGWWRCIIEGDGGSGLDVVSGDGGEKAAAAEFVWAYKKQILAGGVLRNEETTPR